MPSLPTQVSTLFFDTHILTSYSDMPTHTNAVAQTINHFLLLSFARLPHTRPCNFLTRLIPLNTLSPGPSVIPPFRPLHPADVTPAPVYGPTARVTAAVPRSLETAFAANTPQASAMTPALLSPAVEQVIHALGRMSVSSSQTLATSMSTPPWSGKYNAKLSTLAIKPRLFAPSRVRTSSTTSSCRTAG